MSLCWVKDKLGVRRSLVSRPEYFLIRADIEVKRWRDNESAPSEQFFTPISKSRSTVTTRSRKSYAASDMATSALARSLLIKCGTCITQPAADWKGVFPLPSVLADFYQDIGPRNIHLSLAGGNPTVLPALSLLWDQQIGFRFHGRTGEQISDWPEDWLVVAAAAGEAFILDVTNQCILHALPGAAQPGIPPLFESLNTMAAALAALELVDIEFNDECLILPRFRQPLLESISPFVGGDAEAVRVINELGYVFSESNQCLPIPTYEELHDEEVRSAASRHHFAVREAVRQSDVLWQMKDYHGIISMLTPYENDLERLYATRLKYCRKKCQS